MFIPPYRPQHLQEYNVPSLLLQYHVAEDTDQLSERRSTGPRDRFNFSQSCRTMKFAHSHNLFSWAPSAPSIEDTWLSIVVEYLFKQYSPKNIGCKIRFLLAFAASDAVWHGPTATICIRNITVGSTILLAGLVLRFAFVTFAANNLHSQRCPAFFTIRHRPTTSMYVITVCLTICLLIATAPRSLLQTLLHRV